jgi:hypothetical protein
LRCNLTVFPLTSTAFDPCFSNLLSFSSHCHLLLHFLSLDPFPFSISISFLSISFPFSARPPELRRRQQARPPLHPPRLLRGLLRLLLRRRLPRLLHLRAGLYAGRGRAAGYSLLPTVQTAALRHIPHLRHYGHLSVQPRPRRYGVPRLHLRVQQAPASPGQEPHHRPHPLRQAGMGPAQQQVVRGVRGGRGMGERVRECAVEGRRSSSGAVVAHRH